MRDIRPQTKTPSRSSRGLAAARLRNSRHPTGTRRLERLQENRNWRGLKTSSRASLESVKLSSTSTTSNVTEEVAKGDFRRGSDEDGISHDRSSTEGRLTDSPRYPYSPASVDDNVSGE